MIEPTTGKTKARRDVFRFEIRQLFEDLLLSEPCGEKIQDVNHPNPHPTNAGPPSALCRIHRDAFCKFSHDENLLSKSTAYIIPNEFRSTGWEVSLLKTRSFIYYPSEHPLDYESGLCP